jgi:hypothetical protein
MQSTVQSAINHLWFSRHFKTFGKYLFILILLLGPLALPNFKNIWFGYPPVGDLTTQFWPIKLVAVNAIKAGHVPLWDPYQFSGVPLLADPQNSLLYPSQLLFYSLPVSKAFAISFYMHFVLISLGTFLLMRRYVEWLPALAGTLAFILGGTILIRLMQLPHLQTLTWIPWIFLCLDHYWEDRHFFWWIALGVLLAFQVLAGFPTFFFFTLLAVCFYLACYLIVALYNREWKLIIRVILSFIFSIILAGMLSAAQWMPTLEFMSLATRISPDYSFVKENSLPLINLITAVMPEIFGSALTGTAIQKAYWAEHLLYIGGLPVIITLLFVVCSKGKKTIDSYIYLILAAIFLVLSFGVYNPVYRLFYNYLPVFKQIADPGRMVIFYALFIAVASAISIQFFSKWLPSASPKFQKQLMWGAVVLIGILVVALLVLTFGKNLLTTMAGPIILKRYGQEASAKMKELDVLFATQSLSIFTFICVCIACYLVIRQRIRSRISASTFVSLCFVIIILDVGFFALRLTNVIPLFIKRDSVLVDTTYTPSYVSTLHSDKTKERLLPLNSMEFNNKGSQYGIPAITGYNPLILASYMDVLGLIRGNPVDPADRVPMITSYDSPLLKMLNVRYVLSDEPLSDPSLELINKGDGYLYKNSFPNNYAYMIYNAEYYENNDQIFARLSEPSFDPLQTVLLENKLQQNTSPKQKQKTPKSMVLVTDLSSNDISLDVSTDLPGWLVLSEIYYPGWKAYVDGYETEIQPANYILRSVKLDSGKHKVVISYDPRSVNTGILISLVGAFLIMLSLSTLLIKRYNRILNLFFRDALERIKVSG